MLGLGFMLLEMGFVHKLVLYLAHPMYAAAVAIASFLVFAGVGSQCSNLWRLPERNRVASTRAAAAIVLLALLYLAGMDAWLALTQAWPVTIRCLVAAATIAPLAFSWAICFPLASTVWPVRIAPLVPWSWAINEHRFGGRHRLPRRCWRCAWFLPGGLLAARRRGMSSPAFVSA